jgi:hypothetical protein
LKTATYFKRLFNCIRDNRNGVVINAKQRCRVIGGRRHLDGLDAGNMTGEIGDYIMADCLTTGDPKKQSEKHPASREKQSIEQINTIASVRVLLIHFPFDLGTAAQRLRTKIILSIGIYTTDNLRKCIPFTVIFAAFP